MLRRPFATALLTGILLSPASTASADPATRREVADALFWQGRRAAESRDMSTACDRFARSLALDRLPGTLLNLASCEESRGRLAAAFRHYQDAALLLKPDDRRSLVASDRVASLEPRIPRLTLSLAPGSPAATRVTFDGRPSEQFVFQIPRPLDPGTHRLRVTAPGRATRVIEVTLAASESKELSVEPGPVLPRSPARQAHPPSQPPVPPATPTDLDRGRAQRTFGWSLLGLGGAGVVLGAVSGGVVLQEKSTFDRLCPGSACRDQAGLDAANRGIAWGTTANIAFASAAVAAGVGLILVLTAPIRPPRAERTSSAR